MQIDPINCPQVPKDFHLKLRKRFIAKLRAEAAPADQAFGKSFCFFKGIQPIPKNHEDTNHLVVQESTFWYLFGVKETGCYAIIHNDTGNTTLFVPRLDQNYKLWMVVRPNQQFQSEYMVEGVHFVDQLEAYIGKLKASKVYLYSGVNSDSQIDIPLPETNYYQGLATNSELLLSVISNLRAVKTSQEIELIRYVCKVTTEAHLVAMKSAKPGLKQMQLHTVFHFQHSIKSGSIQLGFDSICSSGQDCATLHYIENDKIIKQGQLLLHDMGGKWYGYNADQAISFPVDGKFTQKQRDVYNAVYFAQKAVLEVLKPGVQWQDMHLLAQKVILEHLIKMGIVNQFPMHELQQKRIGAIFFPHGLGHLFGLMVHDVGGYTAGRPRSDKAGLKSLRTSRIMEEGICITVQPGLYFIDFIIQKSLADPQLSKYLNEERINYYKEVGGVRLEDDVVITKNGAQMLSFLPRSIQEVEQVLRKKP